MTAQQRGDYASEPIASEEDHARVDAALHESDGLQFSPPALESDHKPRKSASSHHVRTATLTPTRVLHLLRRALIFAAAILYLHVSISACIDSIHILRGAPNPPMDFVPYDSPLVAAFAGTTTIRHSPLVQLVLQNDTSPRSDTVYLEDAATTSFTTCTQADALPPEIYTNAFQRALFAQLVDGTQYNISLLDPTTTELIVPIVDCTCSSIAYQDLSGVQFFYLLRSIATSEVFLLTVAMSTQEYKIIERKEFGSAAVATLAFLSDLQATRVTHYFAVALGYPFVQAAWEVYELVGVTTESFWHLQSVPRDPTTTKPTPLQTACRTGFYLSSETEQANIKNTIWGLSDDPLKVLATWPWMGRPVLRDSWAWTHCIHGVLAFDVLVHLVVLLVVIGRHAKRPQQHRTTSTKGKHKSPLWIGDAFVAISTSLWVRSALVVLAWYVDKWWALIEFSLHDGNVVSNTQSVFLYPAIMRADLLALFCCAASVIGSVLNERVDPALTIGVFYAAFQYRLAITVQFFPALVELMTDVVAADYSLAMSDDASAVISPLRVWSAHALATAPSLSFIWAALAPVFSALLVIVAYVACRKLYRCIFPPTIRNQRITGYSEAETSDTTTQSLLALKHNLTQFELATGAALQHRVGVVADYESCIYVRGVKFASADGVYSSGYVLANNTWLLQTDDLVTVWMMKALRKRFRNVYAYDVADTNVHPQARLVYPESITVQELLALSISDLS